MRDAACPLSTGGGGGEDATLNRDPLSLSLAAGVKTHEGHGGKSSHKRTDLMDFGYAQLRQARPADPSLRAPRHI